MRLQDEASRRLEGFRKEHGALELETIEARAVIKDKTVKALVVPRKNTARNIIENFMICANMTMVDFLAGRWNDPVSSASSRM